MEKYSFPEWEKYRQTHESSLDKLKDMLHV